MKQVLVGGHSPGVPVLDGDSGKTAGAVIFYLLFMSLRSRPLESMARLESFNAPELWAQRASRLRPLVRIASRL
jgi:hypothetical protein